ncbi:hypothetical protein ACT4VX_15640 [Acinetobacter baumannii]|uniref:hypothetical protein n=1 Tax=Acinetobacter baumannii TaxID=470 RepID=UPI002AB449B3|nr:hypothetical protein [Acinetobacter baumannii]
MQKTIIQKYINNFRRHLSAFLKPGIGLKTYIYPSIKDGAVLVFHLGANLENDDEYQPTSPSIGTILNKVEQKAFGGNLEGIHFSGTNMIFEPNKIIFIKDDNPKEWTDEAAKKEAFKIVNSGR